MILYATSTVYIKAEDLPYTDLRENLTCYACTNTTLPRPTPKDHNNKGPSAQRTRGLKLKELMSPHSSFSRINFLKRPSDMDSTEQVYHHDLALLQETSDDPNMTPLDVSSDDSCSDSVAEYSAQTWRCRQPPWTLSLTRHSTGSAFQTGAGRYHGFTVRTSQQH